MTTPVFYFTSGIPPTSGEASDISALRAAAYPMAIQVQNGATIIPNGENFAPPVGSTLVGAIPALYSGAYSSSTVSALVSGGSGGGIQPGDSAQVDSYGSAEQTVPVTSVNSDGVPYILLPTNLIVVQDGATTELIKSTDGTTDLAAQVTYYVDGGITACIESGFAVVQDQQSFPVTSGGSAILTVVNNIVTIVTIA